MANIRLRYFLRDFRSLECGVAKLEALQQREADRINTFAHEQHADIMRNFNPRISKLKKRRKILMHKDALR